MRFKNKLSKRELANLMHAINRNGFNPCDKYVLGFNPKYNLYEIKLLKDNEELTISFGSSFTSKDIWILEGIEKQLEKYIEQR